MSDIFISYASEDRPQAKVLAEALASEGWSVWWDRTIPTGSRYHQVIEDALRDARCVVVVWTAVSVGSDWVRAEAGEGLARSALVPVSLDDVPPPLVFRQIQTADLRGWHGDPSAPPFRKLVADVTALLGAPSATGTPRPEPPAAARERRAAEATAPPAGRAAEAGARPAAEPAAESPARPWEERDEGPRARGRRRPWNWLAVGVAAALAVGVWWSWFRAQPPEIVLFEVDPPRIPQGGGAVVRWETAHAEEVQLLSGAPGGYPTDLGGVGRSGEHWATPTETTVYTLRAQGARRQEARREVELAVDAVEVVAPPPPSPPVDQPSQPRIVRFEASPPRIEAGERAELRWETAGAEEVSINAFGRVELSGSVRVQPQQTTTYTVEARSPAGNERRDAVVEVVATPPPLPPPPEIVEFGADATTLPAGKRTRLTWRTVHAERVVLDGKPVDPSGSDVVAPAETTVYTLTARNSEGVERTQRLRIVVEEAPSPAQPERRVSGTIELPEGGAVDLDSGKVGRADSSRVDVAFVAKSPVDRYLEPQNGAVIAAVKAGSLRAADGDPEFCRKARLDTKAFDLARLPAGSEVCVRTDQGRLAWLRVEKPAGRSPGVLWIYFATWETR